MADVTSSSIGTTGTGKALTPLTDLDQAGAFDVPPPPAPVHAEVPEPPKPTGWATKGAGIGNVAVNFLTGWARGRQVSEYRKWQSAVSEVTNANTASRVAQEALNRWEAQRPDTSDPKYKEWETTYGQLVQNAQNARNAQMDVLGKYVIPEKGAKGKGKTGEKKGDFGSAMLGMLKKFATAPSPKPFISQQTAAAMKGAPSPEVLAKTSPEATALSERQKLFAQDIDAQNKLTQSKIDMMEKVLKRPLTSVELEEVVVGHRLGSGMRPAKFFMKGPDGAAVKAEGSFDPASGFYYDATGKQVEDPVPINGPVRYVTLADPKTGKPVVYIADDFGRPRFPIGSKPVMEGFVTATNVQGDTFLVPKPVEFEKPQVAPQIPEAGVTTQGTKGETTPAATGEPGFKASPVTATAKKSTKTKKTETVTPPPGTIPPPSPSASGMPRGAIRTGHKPTSESLKYTVTQKYEAVNNALQLTDRLIKEWDQSSGVWDALRMQAAQSHSGISGILGRVAAGTLTPGQKEMVRDLQSLSEAINTIRSPLGATGFRGQQGYEQMIKQISDPIQDPDISLGVLQNTKRFLEGLRTRSVQFMQENGMETVEPQPVTSHVPSGDPETRNKSLGFVPD